LRRFISAASRRASLLSPGTLRANLRVTPRCSHKPNAFASHPFGFRLRAASYDLPMPRKGPAYPITNEWRRDVRVAINAMRGEDGKPLSDAAFAKFAKISKAALSEALAIGSVQTTVMPDIHKALGWPPPRLVLSPDQLELLAQWDAMDDFERGAELERARSAAQRVRNRRTGRAR